MHFQVIHVNDYDKVEENYVIDLFDGPQCINEKFGKMTNLLAARYRTPQIPRQIGSRPCPSSLEAARMAQQEQPSQPRQTPPRAQTAPIRQTPPKSQDPAGNGRQGSYSGSDGGVRSPHQIPPRFQQQQQQQAHRGMTDSPRGLRGNSPRSDRSGSSGSQRDTSSRLSNNRNTPPKGSARSDDNSNWATWQQGSGSETSSSGRHGLIRYNSLNFGSNEYHDVYVSYIENPRKFWCQLAKSENDLAQLMDDLNTLYGAVGPREGVLRTTAVSQPCVAPFSEDGQWYRARIMHVKGNQVTVQFVDHGNEETMDISMLKEPRETSSQLPVQAFPCALSEVGPMGDDWTEEAIAEFERMTSDNKLVAAIAERRADLVYEVDLVNVSLPTHPNIKDELVRLNMAKNCAQQVKYQPKGRVAAINAITRSRRSSASSGTSVSSQQKGKRDVAGPVPEVKLTHLTHSVGSRVEVGMAHVNSPSQFWMQTVQLTPNLEELMAKLASDYSQLNNAELRLSAPKLGTFCVARYSEDDEWYRGEVVGMERSSVRIKFVDYGNGEWMTPDKIRQMRKEYTELPAQAFECSLDNIRPIQEHWSEDISDKFEDLTYDENKKLMVEIVSVTKDNIHKVRLLDTSLGHDIDCGQMLVQMGLAEGGQATQPASKQRRSTPPKHAQQVSSAEPAGPLQSYTPLKMESGRSFKAAIVWVNSPMDFYCHTEQSQSKLEPLMSDMFDYYQCLKLNEGVISQPQKGHLCIAPYEDDGGWYRATITAMRDTEARVQFADYGNKQVVPISKLKQIKPEYMKLPAQAIKCSLDGIEQPSQWNQKAVGLFERLTNDVVMCTVMSLKDSVYIVEVQDPKGNNVAEQLIKYGVPSKPGWQPQRTAPRQSQRTPPRPSAVPQQARSPMSQSSRGTQDRYNDRGSRNQDIQQDRGYQRARPKLNRMPSPEEKWDDGGPAAPAPKPPTAVPSPKAAAKAIPASSSERQISGDYKSLISELQPGNTVEATVCFTESPSRFYVQLTKYIPSLDEVYNTLSIHYDSLDATKQQHCKPVVGRRCVAKFVDDGCFYRGKIFNRPSSSEAEVHFVDYGNSQMTPISELKTLLPKFAEMPAQALKCSLSGVNATTPDAIARLKQLIDDQTCNMLIDVIQGNKLQVHLMLQPDNVKVNEVMIEEFGVASAPTPAPVAAAGLSSAFPQPPVPETGEFSMYITHAETPGSFYIQLSEHEESITELAEDLLVDYQKMSAEECRMQNAAVGRPCVCMFSEDQAWYRAVIISLQADSATVRFVDYGNCDTVPVAGLKEVMEKYRDLPMQSVYCHLNGLPQLDWSAEDIDKFNTLGLAEDAELTVQFVSSTWPIGVTVKDKGNDVVALFTGHAAEPAGQAQPQASHAEQPGQSDTKPQQYSEPIVPSGMTEAYLSSVDTPQLFYLQIAGIEDELADLSSQVTAHYKNLVESDYVLTSLKAGDVCCGLFSEDGSWYRGVVESVAQNQADVRFVDYGNKEITDKANIKELSSDFMAAAPYAYKCMLYGLAEATGGWTEEAMNKFTALTEDVLRVEFKTYKAPFEVQLYVGETNINDEMGQYGSIKHTESVPAAASTASQPTSTAPSEAAQTAPLETASGQKTTDVIEIIYSKTQSSEEQVTSGSYMNPTIPNKVEACMASQIDSMASFYIQLTNQLGQLEEYSTQLNEEYSAIGPDENKLQHCEVGRPCCSVFSEDEFWYRGIIESFSAEGKAMVRFVDYGNLEESSTKSLKIVTPNHLQKSPFAMQCCLADVSQAKAINVQDVTKFRSMIEDKDLVVEFTSTSYPYVVRLTVADLDVNAQFRDDAQESKDTDGAMQEPASESESKEQSLCENKEPSPEPSSELTSQVSYTKLTVEEEAIDVLVSHIDSPTSFYIQLSSHTNEIEGYLGALYDEYTALDKEEKMLKNRHTGQPCCALFSEDESWYRGLLMDVQDEKSTVLFVDYGNSEQVSIEHIKELDDVHLQKPMYSQHCKLTSINREMTWSQEQCDKFKEIATAVEVVAKVITRTEEPYEVELTVKEDGKSIREVLLGGTAMVEDVEDGTAVIEDVIDGTVVFDVVDGTAVVEDVIDGTAVVDDVLDGTVVVEEVTSNVVDGVAMVDEVTKDIPQVGDVKEITAQVTAVVEASPEQQIATSGSTAYPKTHIPEVCESVVVAVESPTCFYVQPQDTIDALEEVMEKLGQDYDQTPGTHLANQQSGMPCCTKFSEDDSYYRAKIIDVTPEGVKVLFVDYGNKETKNESEICQLREQFLEVGAYTIQCCLAGVKSDVSAELAEKFAETTQDKTYTTR